MYTCASRTNILLKAILRSLVDSTPRLFFGAIQTIDKRRRSARRAYDSVSRKAFTFKLLFARACKSSSFGRANTKKWMPNSEYMKRNSAKRIEPDGRMTGIQYRNGKQCKDPSFWERVVYRRQRSNYVYQSHYESGARSYFVYCVLNY